MYVPFSFISDVKLVKLVKFQDVRYITFNFAIAHN